MTREIKFRAWDGKEMFDVSDISLHGRKVWSLLGESREGFTTLMQFTGLKDKNGKEIYEGDVVRHDESGNWEVRFRFGSWHLFGEYPGLLYPEATGFDNGGQHPNLEIIGNIYESPDLLKA